MSIKIYMTGITIALAVCLCGCSPKQTEVPPPTEPIVESTAPSEAKEFGEALEDAVDLSDPEKYQDGKDNIWVNVSPGGASGEQEQEVSPPEWWDGGKKDTQESVGVFLWEKPVSDMYLNTVVFDSSWDAFVTVSGSRISIGSDPSILPNFGFFSNSYAELETVYYVDGSECKLTAEKDFSQYLTQRLEVSASHRDDSVGVMGLSCSLSLNAHEISLEAVTGGGKYDDGTFGFGCLEQNVLSIIGEPEAKQEIQMGDGFTMEILSYRKNGVSLVLEFMRADNMNSGESVLTGVSYRTSM